MLLIFIRYDVYFVKKRHSKYKKYREIYNKFSGAIVKYSVHFPTVFTEIFSIKIFF